MATTLCVLQKSKRVCPRDLRVEKEERKIQEKKREWEEKRRGEKRREGKRETSTEVIWKRGVKI